MYNVCERARGRNEGPCYYGAVAVSGKGEARERGEFALLGEHGKG